MPTSLLVRRPVAWTKVLPVVALVSLALILRLHSLGAESLWLDEATSLFLARMDIPTLTAWTAHDIHPPLYYILLHLWLVFGESEFALRSLSVVAGVFGVVGIFLLASALFDKTTALLAALLLSVSPLHLWYSQEVRMYALVTTLTLFASWYLAMALESQRRRHWAGYVICSTLALYTHYYAIFLILSHWAIVIFWIGRARGRPHRQREVARAWVIVQGIIFLLFLPWLPTLARQVLSGGGAWVAQAVGTPSLRALPEALLLYVVGPTHAAVPALWRRIGYGVYGLAGLLSLAALRRRTPQTKRDRWGILFCLLYLLVPLGSAWAISQVKPLFATRYLLPFLPPFVLLVAYGLSSVSRRSVRFPGVLLAAIVPLAISLQMQATAQNVDWRQLAAALTEQSAPGDVVLFDPGWYSKPFDYY
ncbi:MAG: hypothetical protein GXP41_03070, partial [Chloroflexi bacterium]|nr:hypothetical protein [Chloroflexota bacterium]